MMYPPFGSDDYFWDDSPGLSAWRSKAIIMRGTLSGAYKATEKTLITLRRDWAPKMALLREVARRGEWIQRATTNPTPIHVQRARQWSVAWAPTYLTRPSYSLASMSRDGRNVVRVSYNHETVHG